MLDKIAILFELLASVLAWAGAGAGWVTASEPIVTSYGLIQSCMASVCVANTQANNGTAAAGLLAAGGVLAFISFVIQTLRMRGKCATRARAIDYALSILGLILIAAGFAVGYMAFADLFKLAEAALKAGKASTPGMGCAAAAIAFGALGAILTVLNGKKAGSADPAKPVFAASPMASAQRGHGGYP